MAVEAGEHRERVRVERLERGDERVGDDRLGGRGEALLLRERADVVAGGEDLAGAREDQAAGLQAGKDGGERVEDLVVERVALGLVVDRQPRDVRRRLVEPQLPARELLH